MRSGDQDSYEDEQKGNLSHRKHGKCGPGAGGKFISEQSRDSRNTLTYAETPDTHTRVRGDSRNTRTQRLQKHTLTYAETPDTHTRIHMCSTIFTRR